MIIPERPFFGIRGNIAGIRLINILRAKLSSKRPNTLEEFERFARENGYATNNGMVYFGTDREKALEFVDSPSLTSRTTPAASTTNNNHASRNAPNEHCRSATMLKGAAA